MIKHVGSIPRQGFRACNAGNVGVTFGMLSVPVLLCAGAAIDFNQANHLKSELQKSTDAAILSAMSARNLTSSQRTAQAAAMFASNVAKSPIAAGVTPQVSVDETGGTIIAKVDMRTSLLRVVGITELPVQVKSRARSYARTIELALMTDVTGSMSESAGSSPKIDGLKKAAEDLLDIILPDDAPADATARVALIPFANYVNAGAYASAVTGMTPTRSNAGATEKLITCVTERTGSNAATDAAPAASNWIGNAAQGRSISAYSADGICNRGGSGSGSGPLTSVMPLTRDKSSLMSTIGSFTPSGSTAGHLGTAWAWYALSPQWNGIWGLDTPIATYSDPKVMKVAVLMTDGEYNTQYSTAASAQQALALCTGMKSAGITVYTVGFGMSNTNATDIAAMATLSQCATSKDTFFVAYDGDALREVFKAIGGAVASQNAILTD